MRVPFRQQRRFLIVPKSVFTKRVYLEEANVYALQVVKSGFLRAEALEAARRAVRKAVKKTGRLVLRTNAFLALTKKPAEVRMGKGKGKIKGHVAPLRAGAFLFELRGVTFYLAKQAFKRAESKLRLPTRVVAFCDR